MNNVIIADSTAGARYEWPHHTNELLLDRKDSEGSEIFMTAIRPGESCPFHAHAENEQVYYMISGRGELRCRPAGESWETVAELRPGLVVYLPRRAEHAARCVGDETLVYLCVDVFPEGRPAHEPTWDAHVEAVKKTLGLTPNA